ncbi:MULTISPECIES: quinol:cytochrome C oxidoreductase [unclassified Flavobacterium]|uniref:quinol:cytochrome C oxidoreductase n=1 Tax=unclassified Flavobacterium TaxID=196869 RepID=UPI001F141EFF|nr:MULTISPECIES: quinol:cytochrome C oxidoreductase [unclassified Flavobacterium]UMY66022.1 quinol:cytochrome C oxidoreductase [Flavobacterium sp. HJ-32-4]
MYTFSSKLKTLAFVLMVLGALGIGYGFLTAPKSIEDVEKILSEEEAHHGGGHGGGHEVTPASTVNGLMPAEEAHEGHEASAAPAHESAPAETKAEATAPEVAEGTATVTEAKADSVAPAAEHAAVAETAHAEEPAHAEAHGHEVSAADAEKEHHEHLEHVLHQLQNKPWAALYVGCIFMMLISLGVLAFYGIQQVAQAGWSPVLFRVMEGITAYLPVGSIIFFVLLILAAMGKHHLFIWLQDGITDPKSPNYDEMIAGKSGYLNATFWLIRAAIFLAGWNAYRWLSRRNGLAQDEANDDSNYKRNFKLSAGFLVFFIVSESIMAWDWIMSVDPHWFSTLFGWYVFASFFVSGITMIAMVTFILKSQGYLPFVNNSHIHDLAKFMFGISVFWTYLWFSQFMLIWYSNIPEEVTYFKVRIEHFGITFWGAFALNFILPILILINSDFKRLTWIVVMAGIIILFGHYVDFYNMIMPATVGDRWFMGAGEIGALAFFAGLFIFVVFTALTKAPLLAKRNPFIEESKHFHY